MGNNLVCPYERCGKEFKQPLLLTSKTGLTRESYYACPHCYSKVELILKDEKDLSSVKAIATDGKELCMGKDEKPEGCLHYVGYLKGLPEEAPIPEDCLTCPKIMVCFVRCLCE